MGGDMGWELWLPLTIVSIHAPTWGATAADPDPTNKQKVSIHAPTWGATTPSITIFSRRICFNPRPHMGGDFSH